MRLVRQGGGGGVEARHRDVERQADAVHRLLDRQRGVAEADAQAAQTVDLGEGAGDDDVGRVAGQAEAGLPLRLDHELGIGLVHHQDDVRRQGGVQTADFLARIPTAGRVRRIGDIDDAGALIDLFEDGLDLGLHVRLGRQLDLGAAGLGRDAVGEEAVLAGDDVVAGLQIGLVQQGEDLVRAVAEDQTLALQTVMGGHGVTQLARAAVGIDVDVLQRGGIGLTRLLAGAQGVLVRGQLHRLGEARDGALAAHIGGDVEDAGLGGGRGFDRVGHGRHPRKRGQ
ncbi:hypothetical protein D3C86_1425440 [compost metagenome]